MRSFLRFASIPRASAKKLNIRGESCQDRADHFQEDSPIASSRDPIVVHIMTSDLSHAFAGRKVTGQHLHRSTFARSVGAQERDELTFRDDKIYITCRSKWTVELGEPNRLDHRLSFCAGIHRQFISWYEGTLDYSHPYISSGWAEFNDFKALR